MNLYDIVFYFFALITAGSAAVVVFSKNIIYSAFSLLFTFFGVAGLYILLNADFLAITQLLVYVGGILVLLLFGVMLTTNTINIHSKSGSLHIVPSVIIISLIAGSLAGIMMTANWFSNTAPAEGAVQSTSKEIGTALITTHVLPFEIASVILLVAVVGAAMMARRDKNNQQ
ncbi:MAG: NADH-quinone oxidoreductase subunit J [Bacteroidota bacterium]|jgi:NADH-quinone oxidoreductase subunit J